MNILNLEQVDKFFYIGKRYLDSGRFREAIEVYDKLIAENYKFLGHKDANLLIETSLNNRGCAKCKLALVTKNKNLYKEGIFDFKKSIDIDNSKDENEKTWLTAYKNLQFSETEIETFDKPQAEGSGLSNFMSI